MPKRRREPRSGEDNRSALRYPPKGSGLERCHLYVESFKEDGWADRPAELRDLDYWYILRTRQPGWMMPFEKYLHVVFRKFVEAEFGPEGAAELFENRLSVVAAWASDHLRLLEKCSTQAQRNWQPEPRVEQSQRFVLAAYLDELASDWETSVRSDNARFEAIADRLGLNRNVVRRVVRKYFYRCLSQKDEWAYWSASKDEAGTSLPLSILALAVTAQFMAEAESKRFDMDRYDGALVLALKEFIALLGAMAAAKNAA